jgi:hypothetical protein
MIIESGQEPSFHDLALRFKAKEQRHGKADQAIDSTYNINRLKF